MVDKSHIEEQLFYIPKDLRIRSRVKLKERIIGHLKPSWMRQVEFPPPFFFFLIYLFVIRVSIRKQTYFY